MFLTTYLKIAKVVTLRKSKALKTKAVNIRPSAASFLIVFLAPFLFVVHGLMLRLTRINIRSGRDHRSITWWRAVMPDMLILLMSMSTLTLLSILMTASPSLSLTLSWNTISSGNLTLRWPGWVRAKKLALRDMTKSYPLQLSGKTNFVCPLHV